MINKNCLIIVLLVSSFVLFGCLPMYQQPTAEQLEQQNRIIALMQSRNPNYQHAQNTPLKEPVIPVISEEEMLKKINAIPKISNPVNFTRKKDGFDANGVRYIDPEGAIVNYACDALTGDATYMIKTEGHHFIIKIVRVLTDTEPLKIATVEKEDSQWKIETVTGKSLRGDGIALLSQGILVARDTTGFIYVPGNNIKNFAAPDGFSIANFQNGEVLQTRYVLVERNVETDDGIISNVKSFGATLGINKKEDYALVNLDGGPMQLINIDVSGKTVASHSQCRKRNQFVNNCENVDFYESLYNEDGLQNGEHYYWRLAWFNSLSGPIVVVREGSKVFIRNVKDNKEVVAFERMLGINWIAAYRKGDGKIEIVAKLGFSKEKIEDAEKYYNENISKAVAMR